LELRFLNDLNWLSAPRIIRNALSGVAHIVRTKLQTCQHRSVRQRMQVALPNIKAPVERTTATDESEPQPRSGRTNLNMERARTE
jgi:hypothetical protein